MMKNQIKRLRGIAFLVMLWCAGHAYAGLTDISSLPLATIDGGSSVKPNIMFILDDSGSMEEEYTPAEAGNFNGKYGFRSSQCNGMYFNPAIKYTPPVKHDGSLYDDMTDLTKVKLNGFSTSSYTVNLNNSYYYAYKGTEKPLAFTYNTNGSVVTTSNFYKQCISDIGGVDGKDVFERVNITTNSDAALKTNFGNWYSYYRSRMQTMKTAAGKAFKDIGQNYRVGFTTINYTGTSDTNSEYQSIADFDATQKQKWYEKLYAIDPNSSTPLRAALSKVGRIYAGKIENHDPVEYSCQQNFAILSTDGYWNGGAGYREDGTTAIGNIDGTLPRPYYDGFTSSTTYTATITVSNYGSNNTNTSVSSIKINGFEIITKASNAAKDRDTVAKNIAAVIGLGGYSASSNGNVVTVKAPTSAGNINGVTLQITPNNGNMPIVGTAFVGNTLQNGGAANSLSDVAAYYYNTDLRPNMEDNVLSGGNDTATYQHMTTFTLGLGVNGTLKYQDGYADILSGDYYDIKQGTKNWPVPAADNPTAIDDLWHAAVNGRGTYFSAQNPESLVDGIAKALAGVKARTGAAAAAATSNMEPVEGDNYAYVAQYQTGEWWGDILAKTIDLKTGTPSATNVWSAKEKLTEKITAGSDTRTIYKFDSSASNNLEDFTWGNLSTAEQRYFNDVCVANVSNPKTLLSQCGDLTDTEKTMASGQNLLKFIRGQYQHEDRTANTNKLFRERKFALGDIISAQPVYLKQPQFDYTDENYADFKSSVRKNVGDARVYVASNDGMLHAFNGEDAANGGGAEEWAYIPPMVMPNLYKLADKNYSSATAKQFYVDGTPTLGDVCPNAPTSACSKTQWKSILVGGLNAGGRGYYALDITNPGAPKALWNYTVEDDADLGYSFGNPVITKRRDGTWVVIFSSGYNNVNPGNGQGYLYVLNAYTGARLAKIPTGAGGTDTPSGLAKINAYIEDVADNTAERIYGADLLGNVWRFDIDGRYPPDGIEATKIAELGNLAGVGVQPVTTQVELGEISVGAVKYPVVMVGTGRYLGEDDVEDQSQQSIYVFKDNLGATGLGKLRSPGTLVKQTLSYSNGKITASNNPVNWATTSGWYVDLNAGGQSPGERVNVDMEFQLDTLSVVGNIPKGDACNMGGSANYYDFDFKTGSALPSANGVVGRRLPGNTLVAGIKVIRLPDGTTRTIVTGTDGSISSEEREDGGGITVPGGKRVSWRELVE
jgi:type IV pilus assembly protein PilY1